MELLSFFYSIIISSENKMGKILKLSTQEKLTDQMYRRALSISKAFFAKIRLSLI